MNTPKPYLNCIIIDDNTIDRLTTLSYVKKYSILNILGVYSSANEALNDIHQHSIDVIFSDIDMPEISGLEFRMKMQDIPVCIFITSFPDYAAESFEVDALDFLVKPLKAERFEKCINRIEKYFDIKKKADLFEHSLGADTIFIKDGHEQIKVKLHDIIYLEGLGNYTRIITQSKKYSVLTSIGNLLVEPAFHSFLRIHRSYAIQVNYIDKISSQQVHIQGFTLPIGRSYKEVLHQLK